MDKLTRYAVYHQLELEALARAFKSDEFLLLLRNDPRIPLLITETRYAQVVEAADPEWQFTAELLGAEDNVCSRCSILNKNVDVSFGFNLPPGATVTKIELDVKCCQTIFNESLWIYIWTGAAFSYFKTIHYEAGIPFCANTIFHGWRTFDSWYYTRDRVNGMKVRLHHDTAAGGGGLPGLELWSTYVDALKMRVTYY